jgi:hypothetical protein
MASGYESVASIVTLSEYHDAAACLRKKLHDGLGNSPAGFLHQVLGADSIRKGALLQRTHLSGGQNHIGSTD